MMEILEMLSSRWLEVAVAAYLIGMMLYGHYRGFIRIAVSVMSLFITLFAVRVAIPQTAAWLEHNTALYETMKESALKASGLDEKMDEMAQTAGLAGKAGERTVIESLEIPDQVKKLLIENNNGEIYQEMGVQIFEDYVGKYLADRVIRVIIFTVLFTVFYASLHITCSPACRSYMDSIRSQGQSWDSRRR